MACARLVKILLAGALEVIRETLRKRALCDSQIIQLYDLGKSYNFCFYEQA